MFEDVRPALESALAANVEQELARARSQVASWGYTALERHQGAYRATEIVRGPPPEGAQAGQVAAHWSRARAILVHAEQDPRGDWELVRATVTDLDAAGRGWRKSSAGLHIDGVVQWEYVYEGRPAGRRGRADVGSRGGAATRRRS